MAHKVLTENKKNYLKDFEKKNDSGNWFFFLLLKRGLEKVTSRCRVRIVFGLALRCRLQ